MDESSRVSPSSLATNIFTVRGEFDATRNLTELHLPDGQVFHLNTSLLIVGRDTGQVTPTRVTSESPSVDEQILVPLVEERLTIDKQVVETAKVRLQKTIQTYEETLDEPLAVRTFDIERVICNRPVDAPPAIRQEGDTTVYPLVEEQLILTKQLILIEEMRVTRRDSERRDTRTITLTREHLVVEREGL